jgi:hypothetical protein
VDSGRFSGEDNPITSAASSKAPLTARGCQVRPPKLSSLPSGSRYITLVTPLS